ncbi:MAG: CRISPR-associated protein Cas5 [Planctomycetia bacterium]|nr:CRISPR-associated protein Cas5 [Planctomycetia bacterium]
MRSNPICLRVKGPFACFTRPEFHVERVSYPIITPSAARGILEAILMKPVEKPEAHKRHNKIGFRWIITRLGVVNKGTTLSILRNELGYATHQRPERAEGYDINADRIRAQRHSLILSGGMDAQGGRQMLDYLIEAVIEVRPQDRQRNGRQVRPSDDWLAKKKYYEMFRRRVRAGQCFYQPFFGCREFSLAQWELVEEHDGKDDSGNLRWRLPGVDLRSMLKINEDFGMLFRDFDFGEMWDHWRPSAEQMKERHPHVPRPPDGWDMPGHRPVPTHFRAKAVNGWITVERGGGA